ncbi:MAG: TonB-dependent receptor, partial [Bacteroides sp.]|nr:TonB-dependent receptor [Bacteroides sp.]
MSENIKNALPKAMILIAFLCCSLSMMAQGKSVTGTVTDPNGEAIIGASVLVKGSTNGTITDFEGNFTLQNVNDNAVLQISYIGYVTQDIPVKGKNAVRVILKEDTETLDEVVVVGYGTQKKVTLTGAVSAVKSDDIIATKNENAQNMLTGKVAGLRVVQKSAEPGAFNNNFDIRGMGAPLIIIDGIPRDNLSRIDPNDIESLSVLKDASAAIYGVRAANGVVLITTKSGKSEKTELNYSGNIGWQMPSGLPHVVDAVDWMTLWNEKKMKNVDGGSLRFSDDDFAPYLNGTKESTDWYDAVIRKTAPQTQHNISATGGNEKTHFYMSAGYQGQEGIFKSGDFDYERFNLRSNITTQLAKYLKVDLNVTGIMDKQERPWESADMIIRSLWRSAPIQSIYANDNPEYLQQGLVDGSNPVAMMNKDITGYNQWNRKWFQSSVSATYDVPGVKGLSAKAVFSYDFNMEDNKKYQKSYNQYNYQEVDNTYRPNVRNNPSKLTREYYRKELLLYQFSLNYTNTFNQAHNVNALILWEGSKRTGDNFYALRELGLDLDQLFAGNTTNQVGYMNTDGGALYDKANLGLVGKFGYDYKSKYLAEFSFRYDGSSMFMSGEQWGFFPAASVGWRFSEENFWKDSKLSFITNAKLRASYGKMGDDSASSYQFITGYYYPASGDNNRLPGGHVFDGTYVNSASNKGIANRNITWYIAKTFDVGIDLEGWNGLIGLSADYFRRSRSGLLATRAGSLPSEVGANLPQENLDSDLTQGIELELNHRNHIGEFSYTAKGIFALTRIKKKHVERARSGNSYENWRNNENNRYKGIWWGYGDNGRYTSYEDIANSDIYVGRDRLPGDYIYVDWDGDGQITDHDRYPIAMRDLGGPLINFSLDLGAQYKGFDLNVLFQGAAKVYCAYGEQLREPLWGSDYSNAMTQFMDRWHPVDPKADPYDPNTQWVSGH